MFLFRHVPAKSASQDGLHPSGQPAADDDASGEYQPADDVLPKQAALLSGLIHAWFSSFHFLADHGWRY